ncbi:MAG TPA: UDP-2,3-diacylglucosamine diphosphatase [Gammaproteobacteria bacterium]|nr:UDP-2,3-diacylglucosamine diphosphatase [Gammaproteobacteria bacterium]
MRTLFISDLHLDPFRQQITAQFLEFLREDARDADALYILGDFFEAWIGDDDPDPHHARVVAGLRDLTTSGVPAYFMHGNRDFLIGERFAGLTGCRLLTDPTVLSINGTRTLLMHGDTLCTDDVDYQRFRALVRNPDWQRAFLAKSLQERRAFAAQARSESRSHTMEKADAIMDVNQQTVERVMLEHDVSQLIHGHTHRPAIHRFTVNGTPLTRIVLGDWYEQKSLLEMTENGPRLLDERVIQP